MSFTNGYQNYQLEVKAVTPGSLSSFLWAYCKTKNVPDHVEHAFIRKSISFAKLSAYVRLNLANDFDLWYRKNEDSPELLQVLSKIINDADGRIDIYQPVRMVSQSFNLPGFPLRVVLVPVSKH